MKKKKNFLDYVPKHNRLLLFRDNERGHVEIRVEHRGFYHRIAQLFFHRPRFSNIELDELGSFIWRQIDGRRSVYEIGQAVSKSFGNKAEPLYERLCPFIQTLHRQGFIIYMPSA